MFWRFNRHAITALVTMGILLIGGWFFESNPLATVPHDGQPPALYSNQSGTDLKQLYRAAIQRAQKSVVMMIYSLNDNTIIHALNDKAAQGVQVTVIGDVEASAKAEGRLDQRIKYYKHNNARGIMHMKILVIDGEETWIGSANMTGESLRMNGNLVMVIPSPSLAKAVIDRAEGMIKKSWFEGYPHQDFVVGDQKLEMWFLPDDPMGVKRLVDLIRSAQKSVRVAMFTWTRLDLADEIIKKHKQGIKTEVILDRNSAEGAGKEVVEALSNAGVPLLLNEGRNLLHYKMMCVDDDILVNGSANWTRSAFSRNDDCFVVLHDLNESQKSVINTLWKKAKADAQEIYEHAR